MIMKARRSWDKRCHFEKCFETSERMADLQSPMFIEKYNFWLSSCDGREQDHLACCRNFHRLFVGRNVLVDCVFLSDHFWTFVGAICNVHAF